MDIKHRIIEIIKSLKISSETKKNTALYEVSRYNDPYLVLISCILSLRTKDKITAIASSKLFKLGSSPKDMLLLSAKEIETAIYPVGFYRRKSEQILHISRILIEEYDSKVPDDLDELLKIKGIGRKTANIVITLGFGKVGLAVDTHVHRISNRIGIVSTKTPEKTEFSLKNIVPIEYWKDLNDLFVIHGQNICAPISPKCSLCMIIEYCDRVGVGRSR